MKSFVDGMESDFSVRIISLIKENTSASRQEVTAIILDEEHPEDAGEALRWIGRVECENSLGFCRQMLELGIKSPHARVRDGAVLGLTSLGGAFALATVEKALKRETCPELQKDMQQSIQSLKDRILLEHKYAGNQQ